jgi:metal-dependent amidase/aminoacylase/carboxypeptidase family protein
VEDTIPTPLFDAQYQKNFESLGGEILLPRKNPPGSSTDVGNVSHVIPVIQPMICITDEAIAGHSIEMREASRSEQGLASIRLGAKALAFTALDLIEDSALFSRIKAEHKKLLEDAT